MVFHGCCNYSNSNNDDSSYCHKRSIAVKQKVYVRNLRIRPYEVYMIWPKEMYIQHQDVISLAQTHYYELERIDPAYHEIHGFDFPFDLESSIEYLYNIDQAYFRETPRRERILGKFRKGL